MELTKKEKAIAFIKSFETGSSKVLNFIDDDIKSHNYGLPNGKSTYEAYFTNEPTGATVETIRVFEDKEFVIMHNRYENVAGYSGPLITFDIVRFKDEKIVEHWDNIASEITETVSGNSMINGPVSVNDNGDTGENRTLVSEYMQVLVDRRFDEVGNYLNDEKYIQHNPLLGNGVSGLLVAMEKFEKEGKKVEFDKVHYIFAQGNFVLAITEGKREGKSTSFYDLYRVEDGKIAEHWDVVEEIKSEEDWKNENGKF